MRTRSSAWLGSRQDAPAAAGVVQSAPVEIGHLEAGVGARIIMIAKIVYRGDAGAEITQRDDVSRREKEVRALAT